MLVDSTAEKELGSSFTLLNQKKHIMLKHHHVRELISTSILQTVHVKIGEQPADLLTNVLSSKILSRMEKQFYITEKNLKNENILLMPSDNF